MKKKIQKPFDVEAAKNGARIETRSGRSVRILCYDRKSPCPILALVLDGKAEICLPYNLDGSLGFDGSTVIDGRDLVIVEEVEVFKFNVGDWLFVENGVKGQPLFIFGVTPTCYEIQDLKGNQTSLSQKAIDKFYHLWTIGNARPGDVLVRKDNNHPFIFSGLYDDSAPTAYCGIDTIGFLVIGNGNAWTRKPVRPATYEERQQFFNKLEEEGYKWDDRTLTLWKKCN